MNRQKIKDESAKNLALLPKEVLEAIELFLDTVSNNTSAMAYAKFNDQQGNPIELSTWKSMASLGRYIEETQNRNSSSQ